MLSKTINNKIKKDPAFAEPHFSCEDRDRTSDLRVMSPTSYRCSTSPCKSRGFHFSDLIKLKRIKKTAHHKLKGLSLGMCLQGLVINFLLNNIYNFFLLDLSS